MSKTKGKLGVGLAITLVIVATMFGWYLNDFMEAREQAEKKIQITQPIGPSGVIDLHDITRTNREVRLRINNPIIIGVDEDKQLSMLPFIDAKATIIGTENYEFDELKIGDIIVYDFGNSSVMHAIVGIREDNVSTYFVMRGYNSFAVDQFRVREYDITHKVTGVLYGGSN